MSVDAPERPKITGVLYQGNITQVPWNKDNPESVERARRVFMDSLLAGMAAFETVTEQGPYGPRRVEVSTREFNPETESIRMTAQYAGG